MDMMIGENKNLKDSSSPSPLKGEGWGEVNSKTMSVYSPSIYPKANKLVTALYMVTDIMDTDEPIRIKLRTLGVNILSDTNLNSPRQYSGEGLGVRCIQEIISLLDIARTLGMISEMNHIILKKEFNFFKDSISQPKQDLMLSEFFSNSPLEEYSDFGSGGSGRIIHPVSDYRATPQRGELKNSKGLPANSGAGHQKVNLGVQKGSTLLHALNKISGQNLKDNKENSKGHIKKDISLIPNSGGAFELLKKRRKEIILKIIKNAPYSADGKKEVSIKDIISSLRILGEEWGEKTLQRELISMVSDGVLNKSGEKRWSRYSIN